MTLSELFILLVISSSVLNIAILIAERIRK